MVSISLEGMWKSESDFIHKGFLKVVDPDLTGGYQAMAPHSNTLAWKIPWTEEPGRLQSMGWLRVGHDWVTSLSLFTFTHWSRKWQPISYLENPRDGGAWWAAVCGVTQSRTWLKRLSSSSNSVIITAIILIIFFCLRWLGFFHYMQR